MPIRSWASKDYVRKSTPKVQIKWLSARIFINNKKIPSCFLRNIYHYWLIIIMGTRRQITYLSIQGFKSIRNLDRLRLSNLNVLIGGNGVGKSNFVDYFRMLSEIMAERLQIWVSKQG